VADSATQASGATRGASSPIRYRAMRISEE
jgi:hypothetical protein